MAEMLFRVVDQVNPNSVYLDCGCTKRADVIVVKPDGWGWSTREKTNPAWRIIKVFGYSVTDASVYVQPEAPVDPNNPSLTLQARGVKLDLSSAAWPANFQAWLADDTRATPVLPVVFGNVTQQMALLKILKAPIPDPNVIG